MKKTFLLAGAAILFAAGAAQAADIVDAPVSDWSGFYAGINALTLNVNADAATGTVKGTLEDGKLKGIVSRADLLRALVAPPHEDAQLDDERVRRAVMAAMKKEPWTDTFYTMVEVKDGVVTFHGFRRSDAVQKALRGIETGEDVVTFQQRAIYNGQESTVVFSLSNQDEPFNPGGTTRRGAWHVCAWRRELVAHCVFPSINYGEDKAWSLQARQRARSETHIPRIIHTYRHDATTTAAPEPS